MDAIKMTSKKQVASFVKANPETIDVEGAGVALLHLAEMSKDSGYSDDLAFRVLDQS